ncbi:hypothetical protein ACFVH6_22975 [Spirillospora sp. NPDC127200]
MGAGKSTIDRDEARKILKKLEDNLAEFQRGYGTPQDIANRGNVTIAQLGGPQFSAGSGMSKTTANAFQVINGQYNAFVQSYSQVIETLRRAIQSHEDKEVTNTAAANAVKPTNIAQPTVGNTRPLV